jgi:hypothetical protein
MKSRKLQKNMTEYLEKIMENLKKSQNRKKITKINHLGWLRKLLGYFVHISCEQSWDFIKLIGCVQFIRPTPR